MFVPALGSVGVGHSIGREAGMRGAVRRRLLLVVGLAGSVVGLVGSPAGALGQGASSGAGGSKPSLSSLIAPLVVPGVQALDGDQQALDAERVRQTSSAA